MSLSWLEQLFLLPFPAFQGLAHPAYLCNTADPIFSRVITFRRVSSKQTVHSLNTGLAMGLDLNDFYIWGNISNEVKQCSQDSKYVNCNFPSYRLQRQRTITDLLRIGLENVISFLLITHLQTIFKKATNSGGVVKNWWIVSIYRQSFWITGSLSPYPKSKLSFPN